MKKKRTKKRTKRITLVFLLAAFLGHGAYQAYSFLGSALRTEPVLSKTVEDSAETQAVFVREEEPLSWDSDEVVDWLFQTGDRVAKGEVVGEIYENEEEILQQNRLKVVEKELAKVEELERKHLTAANPSLFEKKLTGDLKEMTQAANQCDFERFEDNKNTMERTLANQEAMLSSGEDFCKHKTQLQQAKTEILRTLPKKKGEIVAGSSGYFVASMDGFEDENVCKNAARMSAVEIKALLSECEKQRGSPQSRGAKIVTSHRWSILCTLSNESAKKLPEDGPVKVQLKTAGQDLLECKVLATARDEKGGDAALVLQCDYNDAEILRARAEPIRICFGCYKGLKIHKNALHEQILKKSVGTEEGGDREIQRKVQGVFVKNGRSQTKFVEVAPIYFEKDFVLCDASPADDVLFSENTIQLHDEVIVGRRPKAPKNSAQT